ncbi:MAG: hypothetical protein AAF228_14150 [Pseudomonadota bacterium]
MLKLNRKNVMRLASKIYCDNKPLMTWPEAQKYAWRYEKQELHRAKQMHKFVEGMRRTTLTAEEREEIAAYENGLRHIRQCVQEKRYHLT